MIVSELAEMGVDVIPIALLDKRLANFEQNQFCILVVNNRGISTDVLSARPRRRFGCFQSNLDRPLNGWPQAIEAKS